MRAFFLAFLSLAPAFALAGDTLVVVPEMYQDSLTDWIALREAQGHSVSVAKAPASGERLKALINKAAEGGQLRYVLLAGDAPARFKNRTFTPIRPVAGGTSTVPIGYVPASVNVVYGSAAEIASDNALADLDGDGSPELIIGRVPCHSAQELKAYLSRVIKHEQSLKKTESPRVSVVASPGRFSPFLDSVIDMTTKQVLRQLIPERCEISALHTTPTSEFHPKAPFREAVIGGLRQDCLAWVYMGHGSRQGLDRLVHLPGRPRMLTHADLHQLREEGPAPTVAALMACHTGCVDGDTECLAERMVLCPGGPLAVIASSRVCMPYGNSVLGIEMLNCLFTEEPESIGEVVFNGKKRALKDESKVPLREAVKKIGLGASPNPRTLKEEIAEHVQMYNLLGDPLLRTP